jgi:hypothetical protein
MTEDELNEMCDDFMGWSRSGRNAWAATATAPCPRTFSGSCSAGSVWRATTCWTATRR